VFTRGGNGPRASIIARASRAIYDSFAANR
jgi:hypothetical protein